LSKGKLKPGHEEDNILLKADFHIHSEYSFDSTNKLEAIIERCVKTGINCVAIADHGTAEGGLKLQRIAPFKVIAAEEVLTPAGEIMGMFLTETIPTRIPVDEAIKRIHDQGGLVCIPHPFDVIVRTGLGGKVMESVIDDIDIIEVFNARTPLPCLSTRAMAFARKYDKVRSAGSDSHTIDEIGRTYIELPEFNGADDFLAVLRQGNIHRKMASPFVHFSSTKAKKNKRSTL
jgi:predicted metal-dependent phosphoesterase TrpH